MNMPGDVVGDEQIIRDELACLPLDRRHSLLCELLAEVKDEMQRDIAAASTTRPLTARQREVLSFLTSYVDEHGFAPAFREIGAAIGSRSTNNIACHLKALERKGWITRPRAGRGSENSASRAIRIVRRPA